MGFLGEEKGRMLGSFFSAGKGGTISCIVTQPREGREEGQNEVVAIEREKKKEKKKEVPLPSRIASKRSALKSPRRYAEDKEWEGSWRRREGGARLSL